MINFLQMWLIKLAATLNDIVYQSSQYLRLLRTSLQRRLQLADDGVSLTQDASLRVLAVLLLELNVPPGVTQLLQLQRFPPQQHVQTLTQTQLMSRQQERYKCD